MTLYAIRPARHPQTADEDTEVVSESKYGWEFLEQAISLWRLVNNARADEIAAIKRRISLTDPDSELRIETSDLRDLVRLIDGIDDAILAAGITDRHWRAPTERLENLAKQVPAMDLTTDRSPQSKTNALAEVMINAVSIRNFLQLAINENCVVVLG